ncbi:MAG: zeta toxin family protein [Lautropia mirabilis]
MEEQGGEPKAERIYQKFRKQGLESTSAQEHPRAILLGGQPGSGKSSLLTAIGKGLADKGGAVVIDPDILSRSCKTPKTRMTT